MRVFNTRAYNKWLYRHYEDHFDVDGIKHDIEKSSSNQLHKHFSVLEIPPNNRHKMYAYCTVGMSADRLDENLTELFLYSPVANSGLVKLLAGCAAYHRNTLPLKTHNAIPMGQPWWNNSQCDHAFLSLPYLDGQNLENFHFEHHTIRCHWLIPITGQEQQYRLKYGREALEKLFAKGNVEFDDPLRKCLVTGD
mgnify:CR=1 FL=1